MSKFTRKAALGAATLAGAMALGGVAFAADDSRPIIDRDSIEYTGEQHKPEIVRFAEANRVLTALEAAQDTNQTHWGDWVIIATSGITRNGEVSEQGFADALAATPLADILDAPVLLNNEGDDLNGAVANYLGNFRNAIVVGGESLFSESFIDEVEDALRDGRRGNAVERIYGANRYETSVDLSVRTIEIAQNSRDRNLRRAYDEPNIFLASGTDFADALAAGAAAANHSGVVVLTDGWDRVYNSVYDFAVGQNWSDWGLRNHGAIYAIGGPAAAAAEAGNPDGETIVTDKDIVGSDRYETATLTAAEFVPNASAFTIASGLNYPDAVVAGAYAANADGALLLTRHAALTGTTADYLESIRSDVEQVFVFGGPGVVSPQVSTDLHNLSWDF